MIDNDPETDAQWPAISEARAKAARREDYLAAMYFFLFILCAVALVATGQR